MTLVLLSFGLLMLIMGVMSIGVLMGREPIKGSCGGMSALGMDTACDICGGDANRCEKNVEQTAEGEHPGELAYDAADTGQKAQTH